MPLETRVGRIRHPEPQDWDEEVGISLPVLPCNFLGWFEVCVLPR